MFVRLETIVTLHKILAKTIFLFLWQQLMLDGIWYLFGVTLAFKNFSEKGHVPCLPHTPTLFWPSCGIKAFWHPIHQEQELRYEFHVQSSSWSVGRAEKHNRLWRESIEWSRSYRIQFAPSDQISMSKIEVELSIFLKELWTCWYNFQKLAKGRVFSFLKWYEKSNLELLTIIQNDLMS